MRETKLTEWRPNECGTRIGDIIRREDGKLVLRVKCRRCTRSCGRDTFHDFSPMDDIST